MVIRTGMNHSGSQLVSMVTIPVKNIVLCSKLFKEWFVHEDLFDMRMVR